MSQPEAIPGYIWKQQVYADNAANRRAGKAGKTYWRKYKDFTGRSGVTTVGPPVANKGSTMMTSPDLEQANQRLIDTGAQLADEKKTDKWSARHYLLGDLIGHAFGQGIKVPDFLEKGVQYSSDMEKYFGMYFTPEVGQAIAGQVMEDNPNNPDLSYSQQDIGSVMDAYQQNMSEARKGRGVFSTPFGAGIRSPALNGGLFSNSIRSN